MDLKQFYKGQAFDAYQYFGAHREYDQTVFRLYAPNAHGVCSGRVHLLAGTAPGAAGPERCVGGVVLLGRSGTDVQVCGLRPERAGGALRSLRLWDGAACLPRPRRRSRSLIRTLPPFGGAVYSVT